jgi:hypothetical protein
MTGEKGCKGQMLGVLRVGAFINLAERLAAIGSSYGVLPAHNG